MPVDPRLQAALDAPFYGQHRFRAMRGTTVARGYAGAPGTGPAGETCSTCMHKVSVQGGNKTFPKCALSEHRWTRGGASDIRVKSPACRLWESR